jgi:hypothetical protein
MATFREVSSYSFLLQKLKFTIPAYILPSSINRLETLHQRGPQNSLVTEDFPVSVDTIYMLHHVTVLPHGVL